MRCIIIAIILALSLAIISSVEVKQIAEQNFDKNILVREELQRLLVSADSSILLEELNAIIARDLSAGTEPDHGTANYDGEAVPEGEGSHGETSSHVSLFGSVSHIEPIVGTVALVLIICAVLVLQSIFHGLHAFTAETSFTTMVVRIENELMIVGCSAFIFKIIVNTTDFLDEKWSLALEFAEILIPILSFCYCGIGVLLIIMALRQCDLWSKAYNLKLIELVDVYLIKVNSIFFRWSWKPMNAITDQMEFRIFHNLFCEMFKIQRDAFAFDEYVHKVFEKFVMTVIEIRPIDWFIVMVVVVINLGRKKLKLDYSECHEHDTGCDEESTLKLFTIVGAVIYACTCIFVYVSRSLEFKIMAKRGVASWRHYSDYLQHMEVNADRAAEKRRLNVEELKAAVLIGKLHQLKREQSVKKLGDRASEAFLAVRRMVSKIHGYTLRRKLDNGNSPEAIEAIMKLALRGSSVKFDPIDPEAYGEHNRIDEEGESVEEFMAHESQHHQQHANPYVHNLVSIEKATEALDGTESELYIDMLKAERRRSMQVQQSGGSDRRTSTMAGGSNRSSAPSRKNTNAVSPFAATTAAAAAAASLVPSMPPLHRAGGAVENDHLRQHLQELKHSSKEPSETVLSHHSSNENLNLISHHTSTENLREIDLEAADHLSVAADSKTHTRSVPTVHSTKIQIAPPLNKRDLDEKSIGNSSDLSDDDQHMLILSQDGDNVNCGDNVMNFDDAASITSTVVTSSKQVLVPPAAGTGAAGIAGRRSPVPPGGLAKQPSNKVMLPKIDHVPGNGLTLKPLPPIRKRTFLASLGLGTTVEGDEETSSKNSFIRSNRFQKMFTSTKSSNGAAVVPSDEIEAAEKPEKTVNSMAGSRGNSARGSTIMATGSFLKKQFTNLGTNMFRRLHKNIDPNNAAVLEDLAAEHRTSVEKNGTEVMDVFLFHQPEIYFECVQLIIIIIALYLALWLTNFIATAQTPFWIIISLLPGVLSTINFIYIIKTAALLKAVYRVDFDAVLEVIEQTETVKQLSDQLRAKVLEHLVEQGDPHEELQKLFHEIDINNNNSLSRQEFELFMNSLGLSFSRRKWKQIYKEIDRNFDNCISFQEFYLFLYPEHDAAMALELKRLKVISKRVFKNAKLLNLNQHKIEGRKRTLSREESIERIKERQKVHRKAVVCLDQDKIF